MTEFNWIRYSAISGSISSFCFVLIHNLLLSTIWFILPFALTFGILTGIGLGWSYREFFEEISILNFFKLFLIYLLPILILTLVIFLFIEPIFTLDEASDPNNTGELLRRAFLIVIPYGVLYGIIQGKAMGGKKYLFPSIYTNFIIQTGISHNFPLFGLVGSGVSDVIVKTQILAFTLITLMMVIFVITLYCFYLIDTKK